jgi:hypothetical protein
MEEKVTPLLSEVNKSHDAIWPLGLYKSRIYKLVCLFQT